MSEEKQNTVVDNENVAGDSLSGASNDVIVEDTGRTLPRGLQKLRNVETWLDKKLGIETQGVERIREDERKPPPTSNIFLVWLSLNIHVCS